MTTTKETRQMSEHDHSQDDHHEPAAVVPTPADEVVFPDGTTGADYDLVNADGTTSPASDYEVRFVGGRTWARPKNPKNKGNDEEPGRDAT